MKNTRCVNRNEGNVGKVKKKRHFKIMLKMRNGDDKG